MIPKGLSDLISEFGIIVAVVASLDDGAVEMIGKRENLAHDDLVKQLFGDEETTAALNRSLEGRMLPRMWSQGEVSCVICKPSDEILVGLLYHDDGARDVFEEHRWSSELNGRILGLWNG